MERHVDTESDEQQQQPTQSEFKIDSGYVCVLSSVSHGHNNKFLKNVKNFPNFT